MLWYNNPDAVAATHEHTMRERRVHIMQRRLLRLADGGDATHRQ